MSAWRARARAGPSRQVRRFQAIAPRSAAATTAWVVVCSSTSPAPIVLATAVPANAPMKLNAAAMRIACCGAEGPGGDRRRDRVRRVVEAVDVVEDDRQRHDDDERERDAFNAVEDLAGQRRANGLGGSASRDDNDGGACRRARARRYPSAPCACPISSSPRSATTRPTPRCRRIACSLRAGYVRQLGSGHLLAAAARLAGQRAGRADHPRGAGPDRRPGDGDAGRPSGGRLAASGRYDAIGPEMGRFKDRDGRDMVLAMTHEEVVATAPRATSSSRTASCPCRSTTSRRSGATSRARAAA